MFKKGLLYGRCWSYACRINGVGVSGFGLQIWNRHHDNRRSPPSCRSHFRCVRGSAAWWFLRRMGWHHHGDWCLCTHNSIRRRVHPMTVFACLGAFRSTAANRWLRRCNHCLGAYEIDERCCSPLLKSVGIQAALNVVASANPIRFAGCCPGAVNGAVCLSQWRDIPHRRRAAWTSSKDVPIRHQFNSA